MSIFDRFDPAERAIINPKDFIKPVPNFPKVAISTFAYPVVERFVRRFKAEEIAHVNSANGRIPIYGIEYGDATFALYLSPVGAPAAAVLMEEVIAMGAENFVYFGSCGVLRRDITEGHFIVPNAAVRDEGTSYHYVESSDEIELDEDGIANVCSALEAIDFPYIQGKTWTTDGIYRETVEKMRERKKQGCIVVEMECAALAAVAQFRKVGFGQFLFAEDNLDSAEWQPRTLHEHGMTHSDRYVAAALECGLRFME